MNSESMKQSSVQIKVKKRDITVKEFDYIYKNKIEANLEEPGKFKYTDINLLFNAYEYWRFEKINKQTLNHIGQAQEDQDTHTISQSGLVIPSHNTMRVSAKKRRCGCVTEERMNDWSNMMSSPQYELFVNIIGIFNILCIVIRQVDFTDTTDFITTWIYI